MKKYWLVNTENLKCGTGECQFSGKHAESAQHNGNARKALAFRKDFLENPVKWFLKE